MISTQQFPQMRVCDVHRILDFDVTPRLCVYCGMCDANICTDCQPKWGRRLRAAAKRMLEPGYRGVSNYQELAVTPEQLDDLKKKGEIA
jgi:hypothetical protein